MTILFVVDDTLHILWRCMELLDYTFSLRRSGVLICWIKKTKVFSLRWFVVLFFFFFFFGYILSLSLSPFYLRRVGILRWISVGGCWIAFFGLGSWCLQNLVCESIFWKILLYRERCKVDCFRNLIIQKEFAFVCVDTVLYVFEIFVYEKCLAR